jgi:hypothetical protein
MKTWLAVPLGIAEMLVRLHEVVDREVVLAVVEPRAASDDLLELDHRVDRAASGRCCGCCGRPRRSRASARWSGWSGWSSRCPGSRAGAARPGRRRWPSPLAVVRVFARLHLVDQVAHGQGVGLVGAEDQRLLVLVDLLHEELAPAFFSRSLISMMRLKSASS